MDVSWRILLALIVVICSPVVPPGEPQSVSEPLNRVAPSGDPQSVEEPLDKDNSVAQLFLQPPGTQHAYFTNESFFVKCSGEHGSSQLSWVGPNGHDVKVREGRIHIEPPPDEQQGLELVFEDVRQKDTGTYTCTDSKGGTVAFELIVYRSITFRDTPESQHAPEGENLTILCTVKADAKPIVTWSFNDSKVKNSDKYHITDKGLTVYKVNREDAGNYTCAAALFKKLRFQSKEMKINVRVQFGPEWKEPHEDRRYSNVGAVTNLTCNAVAEPTPSFEWFKEGEPIVNNSNYVIWTYEESSTLQVKVENSSFGEYSCRVKNYISTKERAIDLERGVTPQPPAVSVTSGEPGALILDIEPLKDEAMKVTGFRVEYRLPSETWEMAQSQHFDLRKPLPRLIDEDDRYILKEMSYDTDYVLRVSAKNAVGYGLYSDEISHKTKSLRPATVTTNRALCRQPSTIDALLSTVASLWLLSL